MKNKLHLLATIIASLLLVQGCMKESIEFDTDGPVRTVLYTAPPSALPATILSVSRVVDVAHNFGTFGDIRYNPDSLPAFVGPPEDWVKDAGLTVRYETSHDRKVCIIEPRAGVSKLGC